MSHFNLTRPAAALALALAAGWSSAWAQIDRVYTTGADDPVSGSIENVSKSGVTLKTGQATQQLPADKIRKIMYQGDPAALTRGREFALDGQYEQALEELRTIDAERLPRAVIKADTEFYRVLSQAKRALAGKSDKAEAVTEALQFARQHSNSWHFFETAKLLGDLALSLDNYDRALSYYGALENAPSRVSQIERSYLTGWVKLKRGDIAAAKEDFEKVAGIDVQSVEMARLKTLAKAGKALALAREGSGEEAVALGDQLIADLDDTDVEMAARIYNARGASFKASGDTEGAILAYLHTHLMFSGLPDAHAEALAQLAELWPEVGHPDRAAEVRQELRQRYPGYEG